MRMLTAEEHTVALLNLAVPSPIFRDTEPMSLVLVSQRDEWKLSVTNTTLICENGVWNETRSRTLCVCVGCGCAFVTCDFLNYSVDFVTASL